MFNAIANNSYLNTVTSSIASIPSSIQSGFAKARDINISNIANSALNNLNSAKSTVSQFAQNNSQTLMAAGIVLTVAILALAARHFRSNKEESVNPNQVIDSKIVKTESQIERLSIQKAASKKGKAGRAKQKSITL
jgi:beta-lactamase regulating signal transducer with metallopeptidase domain